MSKYCDLLGLRVSIEMVSELKLDFLFFLFFLLAFFGLRPDTTYHTNTAMAVQTKKPVTIMKMNSHGFSQLLPLNVAMQLHWLPPLLSVSQVPNGLWQSDAVVQVFAEHSTKLSTAW